MAFTYFSNATRIMFEFNQIYRSMESSLTEAAQFTELLLTPPTVVDPIAPEPLRRNASDVRFERVTFATRRPAVIHRPRSRCAEWDQARPGWPIGRWQEHAGSPLLRMMDIDEGRILIGGQDISKLRQWICAA